MNAGDRVQIQDAFGAHTGAVTVKHPDGICFVKWDSGTTERVHESELSRLDRFGRSWPYDFDLCPSCGQPDNCGDCNHEPYSLSDVVALGGFLPTNPTPPQEQVAYDAAYAQDEPKNPTFRERLAVLWDSRPGK